MAISSFNSKFVFSAILVFYVYYGSTNELPKNLKLSQITDQPINLDHTPFFVFGDSWLDFGNNNYFNTSFRVDRYPYGETYPGFDTGRYTDGRNIADFIVDYANLPLILPYLDPRAQESYIYGVSFASAGAGALIDTNQGLGIPYLTQVTYFTKVVDYLTNKLGHSGAQILLSNGVYLVFIGNNDYTTTNTPTDPIDRNYVEMVVGNTTAGVKEIYNRGARKFLFINMPPLGCGPGPREMETPDGSCYQVYQDYSRLHNQVLGQKLPILKDELDGFNYVLFDYYTILTSMINHPSDYNLTVPNKACCGAGPLRGFPFCGRSDMGYDLCDNPNEYIYWDPFHLTESAYKIVSAQVWKKIAHFFHVSPSMA